MKGLRGLRGHGMRDEKGEERGGGEGRESEGERFCVPGAVRGLCSGQRTHSHLSGAGSVGEEFRRGTPLRTLDTVR